MSAKVAFRVDYPPSSAVSSIKNDISVKELRAQASKALKIAKPADYSLFAVGYLNDVIQLDGKDDEKVNSLGIEDNSVVFLLAPDALKPKLNKRIKKKEVAEEEDQNSDDRYKGLTEDNVIKKFETCKNKKERVILLEYIDIHAQKILAKPEKIKLETLKLMFKSDTLNIPEADLLEAAVKWGKAESKKQGKTPKELKAVLEEAGLFQLIRFPCMDMTEVAGKVTPTGFLTELQLLDLYTYLSAKMSGAKPPLPASFKGFNAKQREGREDRDTSWMLTEDTFKGFRPLTSPSGTPRFWLCVSKLNVFDAKKKYDPLRGYEWATSDMWNSSTVMSSSTEYNYYGMGGWSGYDFGGVSRNAFMFKDTVTAGRMVHAGQYVTMTGLQTWTPTSGYNFAGIVAIKKGTWDDSTKRFKA